MTYLKLAMTAIAASLLAANVNAAVNTETTVSASGTVTFTSANITSHVITNVGSLSAGSQPGGNTLVGTGLVTTDAASQVAVQPALALQATSGQSSRPDVDFFVPGTSNPAFSLHLAITLDASGTTLATPTGTSWGVLSSTPSTSATYYIVMTPGQNVPADIYNYTINAATYSN